MPALTKDHKGIKLNTPYPEKTNTPYWKYGMNIIFWKISSVVPTPRNPQYAVSNPWIRLVIIDRQLPFEYTIASRSTDVMVVDQITLPAQIINHSAFMSMFEREKLSGTSFNDWFRSLKLVLRWNVVYDAHNEITCLILRSMTLELHRQFKKSSPYEMLQKLKSMFEKQAGVKRFDLIQTFHACKQEEGKSVSSYVLKMKGYVEQLERLGYVLPQDLNVSLIMNGLTSDFAGFVRNYNMHNMGKKIGELHALLIESEKGLPKKAATPQVMAIQGGRIQKVNKKSLNAKGKGKEKGKEKDKSYIPKPKNPKPSAKEHPTKDDACHHCKEVGHWKRNCLVYLAEYEEEASWHCHFFRGARKLKQGALYLYVGNGVHALVEAVGTYDLVLPNGLVICLDNCHYAPSITRGVVSISSLVDNGFIQCFTDYVT
ncbi:retrotransposon protein, putative, ty1-copia subclass [Tanacetum coccineum]|uniref:Retrotransposon protein, putative, ty1-copia subclass n=1 Tax=Tanacetum coccineum TaxID=301880 RepID=A0ABQ4WPA6_9ASTR